MSFSPETREVLASNAYYLCELSNGTIHLPWPKEQWSMPYPTPSLRGTVFFDSFRTQPVRIKTPYQSWLRQDITEWMLGEKEEVMLQELKAAIAPPAEDVNEPKWSELDSDDEEFWNTKPVFKHPVVSTISDDGEDVAVDNQSIGPSDQETVHTPDEVAVAEEALTPIKNEAKPPSSNDSPSPRRSSSSSPSSPPSPSLTPDSLTKIRDFWADPDPEEEAIWAEAKSFEAINLSIVHKKLAAEDESVEWADFDTNIDATAVDLGSESEWDPYGDSSSYLVAVEVENGPVYCDRGTQTEAVVLQKKRVFCNKGTQTDDDGEEEVLAAKVFSSVGIIVSAAVVFVGVWRMLGRN